MNTSPEQVRAYYDAYSRDRMLNYRIQSNLRIERAIQFFRSCIKSDDVVLDIGCGIGIATEAMARSARHVIGIDISEQNIWYESLRSLLPSAPTVITLCDVIEHIPAGDRLALFTQIRRMSSDRAAVLLTFPSEFYQQYMAAEARHELQIIDNIITPEQLGAEARPAGFSISYFHLVEVWKQVQYAHCKMESTAELNRRVRQSSAASSTKTKLRRLIDIADRSLFEKRRRKRYIYDVFSSRE
jgi:hypothetical protein